MGVWREVWGDCAVEGGDGKGKGREGVGVVSW